MGQLTDRLWAAGAAFCQKPGVKADNSQWLDAKLAEYKALRDEINNRHGLQVRIFQIHLTFLLALLTVSATGLASINLTPTVPGAAVLRAILPFLLLVIPFESAIMWLRYTEAVYFIAIIGWHIKRNTEDPVNELLESSHGKYAMTWESVLVGEKLDNPMPHAVFRWVMFAGPAFLSLAAVAYFAVLSAFDFQQISAARDSWTMWAAAQPGQWAAALIAAFFIDVLNGPRLYTEYRWLTWLFIFIAGFIVLYVLCENCKLSKEPRNTPARR
jgi:hypothetical protein